MKFVLEDPFVKIAAEPNVQRARETPHHVDTVIPTIAGHAEILKHKKSSNCVDGHIPDGAFPLRDL